jgi:type I restriction enzyme S subunit
MVPTDVLPACVNQHVAIVRIDSRRADAGYVLAFLTHPRVKPYIESFNAGGSRRAVTKGHIESFRIPLPPIAHQRAIAHILGTLDDKIELNRRMSETLEAMAQALFKSWFVDFDPVRAKAEGRDPGLPQPLADLFPARLVDSELGEIPEGWRPSQLGNEVLTVLGGTPSRAEPAYWGGDIPWINSGKANEFRVVEPSEFITLEGLASSATRRLPSRTTVIAITGATLGQISLAEIETCANQSIVGVLGTAALPSEFIYFWTKEHVEDLRAWQTGGAQQHINKNNVNDLPVLCPSESVIAAYLAVACPAFDRIKACCNESRTLAALRDTLLPNLISGKLRVSHAKGILGGVDA